MKSTLIRTITKISRYFLIYFIIISIIAGMIIPPAYAWKPKTHVFLADQVLNDVLDDGKVSIYYVDYLTGTIGSKVGDYAVDPALYQALKNYPKAYRAGSFGPDAYPDITTGQQLIHVSTGNTTSNDWLEHIWKQAKTSNNSEILAFAAGYMTHAAGDLYGHSFVNNFTGAPFEFLPPNTDNGIKHTVMEGYIDKRLAKISDYNVNISQNVKNFMYTSMINSPKGSHLHDKLLNIDSTKYISFVKYFSDIRAELQGDINSYYETLRQYDKKDEWFKKKAYQLAHGAQITYKEAWRDDIDDGLKALPTYSHELAKALFFNSSGKIDKDLAKKLSEQYVYEHLLSMAGAPDTVGYSFQLVDEVLAALPIDFLKDAIKEMKEDLLNYLLNKAFGVTIDQIENYMKNPETYFDSAFSVGGGQHITLADFNHNELHIQDNGYTNPNESADYKKIPATYNTVVMSKLLLLKKDEVNRLWRDLKGDSSKQFTNDTVILGFIDLLDGSNQWLQHDRMFFARNSSVYTQIFMHQTGETSVSPNILSINNPKIISLGSINNVLNNANTLPIDNIKQDCLSYNPANLKIVNEGANGWLLTDGISRMVMLDNEQDAQAALALAKQHTSQCFIGRDNKRTDRKNYIVRYWGGNSGIATVVPNKDCLPYDPANLKIVDEGANGWLLTDGRSRMLMLDNTQDAQAALSMAKQYTKHCFIGRDNKRPDRKNYIIEYWE